MTLQKAKSAALKALPYVVAAGLVVAVRMGQVDPTLAIAVCSLLPSAIGQMAVALLVKKPEPPAA